MKKSRFLGTLQKTLKLKKRPIFRMASSVCVYLLCKNVQKLIKPISFNNRHLPNKYELLKKKTWFWWVSQKNMFFWGAYKMKKKSYKLFFAKVQQAANSSFRYVSPITSHSTVNWLHLQYRKLELYFSRPYLVSSLEFKLATL